MRRLLAALLPQKEALVKKFFSVTFVLGIALAFTPAFSGEKQNESGAALKSPESPQVKEFRFTRNTVRSGDSLQYEFSYENIPGGLAEARDVKLMFRWQLPGTPYLYSSFVPGETELASYRDNSGTFRSRLLNWGGNPPPSGGVEIVYILSFKTRDGKKLEVQAKILSE